MRREKPNVLLALEGIAGSGKSTLRDCLLATAAREVIPLAHIGQFSWLSLHSTRVIIALRAGQTPVGEDTALAAAHHDLSLHARHNLKPARTAGHVVADRLALSSACLLALLYRGRIEHYLERLATVDAARPEVTIVLTTPVEVCMGRLRTRPTARRFGEQPDTMARLAELYEQAADAWEQLTGQLVLRSPAIAPQDTARLVDETIAHLRDAVAHFASTDPPARTWEPDYAPASDAPRRMGPR